jgi:hypothetical protein
MEQLTFVSVTRRSFSPKNPTTKHIKHNRFREDNHNNKMELMNGEVRDAENVMCDSKGQDTKILRGYPFTITILDRMRFEW